jgi:hypothetical protein
VSVTIGLPPLRVFLSYAAKDQAFCAELCKHLDSLQGEGVVQYWCERFLAPGANRQETINQHIMQSDVVIMLISADYLATVYRHNPEVQLARQRHARGQTLILPVILRPVAWQETSLGSLQALPGGGRPLVDWPTHDHGWHEVTRHLRQLRPASPKRDAPRLLLCAAAQSPPAYEAALAAALAALGPWSVQVLHQPGLSAGTALLEHGRKQLGQVDVVVIVQGNGCFSDSHESAMPAAQQVYRYSAEERKSVIVFMQQFGQVVNINDKDKIDGLDARLIEFRKELMQNRVIDFFVDAADLPGRIASALANLQFQHRAQQGGMPRPLPPQPLIAHPYPLDNHFVGRLAERQQLRSWFDAAASPLLVLEAMGGLGKTALAWCFSQFDVLGAPLPGVGAPPLDRRMQPSTPVQGFLWWSFYEVNARFPEFLKAALHYVRGTTGEPLAGAMADEAAGQHSAADRVRELLWYLEHERYFLVLDGFERELRSYIAGYHPDSGDAPPGGDERDARRCIDHDALRFIVGLCGLPRLRSKVLLTSRLFPAELEAADGATLSACRRLVLRDFSDDEVVDLFHHSGITAHRGDIQALAAVYGRHPLAMRLLVGVIRNDPLYPGDLRAADGYDVIRDLVRRQHHILHVAFDSLARRDQQLLSSIAAFRGPVEFKAIAAVDDARARAAREASRDPTALRRAVRELTSRNLLLREERRRQFDLHPVVRKYAYERLLNKQSIHHDLSSYFESFATVPRLTEREHLEPVIELFHQLVASGSSLRALQILQERIYAPLWHQFVDLRTALELFAALAPDLRPQAYSWKAGDLHHWFNQRCTELLFAAGLFARGLEFLAHKKKVGSSSGESGYYNIEIIYTSLYDDASHEVAMLRMTGALGAAATLCVELRNQFGLPASPLVATPEPSRPAVSAWLLDREQQLTQTCLGQSSAAEPQDLGGPPPGPAPYETDATMLCQLARGYRLRGEAYLLQGRPDRARLAAATAREFLQHTPGNSLPRVQETLATDALMARAEVAALTRAQPPGAREALLSWHEKLREDLRRTRGLGLSVHEIGTCLALAEVKGALGDIVESESFAQLALSLASRGELRLYVADALLLLAQSAARQGTWRAARDWATQALQVAETDHADAVYAPVAACARALLHDLPAGRE